MTIFRFTSLARSLRLRVCAAILAAGVGAPAPAGAGASESARSCNGDCNGDGVVGIDELILQVGIGLGISGVNECPAADANGDGAVTIEELVAAVRGALSGCPPVATPTPVAHATATPPPAVTTLPTATSTPTATASAGEGTPTSTPAATPSQTVASSPTPTPAGTATATVTATETSGLGTRRFSLDPQSSLLRLIPGTDFTGLAGHLDFTAGMPDPVSGLARVDVTGASSFISITLGPVSLCIKPTVPAPAAGLLACRGGVDFGLSATQEHNIGTVGMEGFSAETCAANDGTVEGAADPHPGVCNGPITVAPSGEDDSGAGALFMAPHAGFGTQGVPAEISIQTGPCREDEPGEPAVFGFVSGRSRAQILHTGNVGGQLLEHEERGENFSCESWTREDGPGRLVLSVPTIHGRGGEDLVTVFVLDD